MNAESEPEVSLDDYERGDQLGKGSYGTVFKYTRKVQAVDRPSAMAVKVQLHYFLL